MKKIILTVAAVFALTLANAQDKQDGGFGFSKGDFYLGGQINFNSSKTEVGSNSVTTSSTMIMPHAGYFLSDNFAVTAGLMIGNQDDGTDKSNQFGFEVGGRYYFLNMGERFKTYTNFGLGYMTDDNGGNGAEKTNTFGIGGGLGINYFVTSRFAIDFGVSDILSYSNEKTGDVKENSFDLNVNVFHNFFTTPHFGMIYKF